jgi:uncharacterized protein (DUF2141 family)
MRKQHVIFSSLLIFLLGQSVMAQYNLEIEISEIRSNKGVIMLQLFDSNEKVLVEDTGTIVGNRSTITISDLKPGEYAVRYYHDEDLSGKMETAAFGKPVEGYGFSNNVTGRFGPPSFDKWLFTVNKDTVIRLKPTY